MSTKLIKFTNCRILKDHTLVEENLWVLQGKIVNPQKVFYGEKNGPNETIDLKGNIISPGFIDLQIYGGYGIDFTHDLLKNPEGLHVVAKNILKNGITSFCPTLITTTAEVYHKILPLLSSKAGGPHGASILGAHVEGPFINVQRRGAHKAEYVADFLEGPISAEKMYKHIPHIRMVTMCPEKYSSREVIEWFLKNNIVVSLGHSEAGFMTAQLAVESGARMITHLFNAMRNFHHREPGIIGLLASKYAPQIFYSLIPDSTHIHSSAISLAYSVHPAGAIIVSDSTSAYGNDKGIYQLGEVRLEVRDKMIYLAETDIIVGSIHTISDSLKYFQEATGCTLAEALEVVTLHPAQMLNIEDKKGTLDFGRDADFVVLSDGFEVRSTWIAGEQVYHP